MHVKKEPQLQIKTCPSHANLNYTALPKITWYTIYVYDNSQYILTLCMST